MLSYEFSLKFQYIQSRSFTWSPTKVETHTPLKSPRLNENQKQWISSADTFFIASASPLGNHSDDTKDNAYGADVSHRGNALPIIHS
jgi:hypothetical protein